MCREDSLLKTWVVLITFINFLYAEIPNVHLNFNFIPCFVLTVETKYMFCYFWYTFVTLTYPYDPLTCTWSNLHFSVFNRHPKLPSESGLIQTEKKSFFFQRMKGDWWIYQIFFTKLLVLKNCPKKPRFTVQLFHNFHPN